MTRLDRVPIKSRIYFSVDLLPAESEPIALRHLAFLVSERERADRPRWDTRQAVARGATPGCPPG